MTAPPFSIQSCDSFLTHYHESLLAFNEKAYRGLTKDRTSTLNRLYDGDVKKAEAWDTKHHTFLWDYFQPAFNCPYRQRFGRMSEGGKVICNWQALKLIPNCVVYAFGVAEDVSFELELIKRTGCTVHAYDPMVNHLPKDALEIQKSGKLTWKKLGLAKMDYDYGGFHYRTLQTLMKENGDTHIDLMKVRRLLACAFAHSVGRTYDTVLSCVDLQSRYQFDDPIRPFGSLSVSPTCLFCGHRWTLKVTSGRCSRSSSKRMCMSWTSF